MSAAAGLALLLGLALGVSPAYAQEIGSLSAEQQRQMRRSPVVDVFERCKDAVVNISSTQIVEVSSPVGGDVFDQLFDVARPRVRRKVRATSVGSGFVLHPAGYIVTNAHVVARTADRKVIFADGSEFEADIVATDTQRDLAVLKIDPPRPLKTLPLGTSADLMVGETVVAIGNPLGYEHTVTSGVVSAINRSLPVNENTSFDNLVQTDASINPGNSGGPLLNILGQLVGINTAIRADAQNIGFAIPVDQLRALLPEMLDVERRYRLVLGAQVEDLPAGGLGAQVSQVAPDTPAAACGLRAGDVIVAIDGQRVRSVIDYHIALIGRKADEAMKVLVRREGDGDAAELTLTPATRPLPDGARLLVQRYGIAAEPMSEQIAKQLGFDRPVGLVVTAVDKHGPAAKRLREGDLILRIGKYQPNTMADVALLLERVNTGDPASFTALRLLGGRLFSVTATLEAR